MSSGYKPIFEEIILLLGWFREKLSEHELRIITDRLANRGTIDEKMLNDLKVIEGKMKKDRIGK